MGPCEPCTFAGNEGAFKGILGCFRYYFQALYPLHNNVFGD